MGTSVWPNPQVQTGRLRWGTNFSPAAPVPAWLPPWLGSVLWAGSASSMELAFHNQLT